MELEKGISGGGETMGGSVDIGCDMTHMGIIVISELPVNELRGWSPEEDAARERGRDQIMKGSL